MFIARSKLGPPRFFLDVLSGFRLQTVTAGNCSGPDLTLRSDFTSILAALRWFKVITTTTTANRFNHDRANKFRFAFPTEMNKVPLKCVIFIMSSFYYTSRSFRSKLRTQCHRKYQEPYEFHDGCASKDDMRQGMAGGVFRVFSHHLTRTLPWLITPHFTLSKDLYRTVRLQNISKKIIERIQYQNIFSDKKYGGKVQWSVLDADTIL